MSIKVKDVGMAYDVEFVVQTMLIICEKKLCNVGS